MDLSVIVVSFNVRAELADCLDSVAGGAGPLQLEPIVVDNASGDGTGEMLRSRFPGVRLIQNSHNLGFARAANQGLQAARGRFLLLLNPDSRLVPGCLERVVACLATRPACGAATGRVYLDEGRRWLASHTELLSLAREVGLAAGGLGRRLLPRRSLERIWRARWAAWTARTPAEVPSIQGNFLLVRREVVARVGGLDPGYFLYYEDADWCRRIRRAGWSLCLEPAAEVVHTHNQSGKTVAETLPALLRASRRRYLRRQYGWAAALGLRGLAWIDHARSGPREAGDPGDRAGVPAAADGSEQADLAWPEAAGAAGYLVELSPGPLFLGSAGRVVPGPELRLDLDPFRRIGLGELCWRALPLSGAGEVAEAGTGRPGGRIRVSAAQAV